MKNDKKNRDTARKLFFYAGVVAVIAGIAMINLPGAVIVGGLFVAGSAIS